MTCAAVHLHFTARIQHPDAAGNVAKADAAAGLLALGNFGLHGVQLLWDLGSLFRHNLRTKRQQITLEEELDGLEDYIYLQQMRFDGRITVEKSIRVQPAAVLVRRSCSGC